MSGMLFEGHSVVSVSSCVNHLLILFSTLHQHFEDTWNYAEFVEHFSAEILFMSSVFHYKVHILFILHISLSVNEL